MRLAAQTTHGLMGVSIGPEADEEEILCQRKTRPLSADPLMRCSTRGTGVADELTAPDSGSAGELGEWDEDPTPTLKSPAARLLRMPTRQEST